MKKVLVTLSLIAISTFASAQIQTLDTPKPTTIGKLQSMGYLRAELTYTVSEKDTTYSFTFQDASYSTIRVFKTVQFDAQDGTLNAFYVILKSFYADENKSNKDYTRQFKLGKDLLTVKPNNKKWIGIYVNSGLCILSEKDIDKLFNK